MSKMRLANDRQEMVTAGMISTGNIMNLWYRYIRLKYHATVLFKREDVSKKNRGKKHQHPFGGA